MLLGLIARIPLSGIRGNIQFLCVLCDSVVIVSIFLQTEHSYGNADTVRMSDVAQGSSQSSVPGSFLMSHTPGTRHPLCH